MSNKAQGPANTAADLLQNHAPAAQNEGMQHLATGRPDPARDAQRRAAEHLERAAQQAEDLAVALRSEVPADAMAEAEADHGEGQANDPSKADLGSARDAQREASRQLAQAKETPGDGPSTKSAQAASRSMTQAAKGLRAAASPHKGKGKSSQADRSKAHSSESAQADPKEGETGRDEAHLAELKEAIKARTGRAWGELPGHLRSEILQMSQGKYREDYARLIQLYFREIASGRDDETGAKP